MKKTTLLGIGIVLLLVINAATLGFVYFKAGPPPRHPEPKQVIAEMLHFDESQQHQYEEKIAWHRTRINELDGKIRKAKEQLYETLADNNSLKKDSLTQVLTELHKEIEETHYKHFSDIKSICKPEQQIYYKQLILDLPHLFGPQHKPKHKRN
ncbi:hypothetical protein HYN59_12990 [Flavobacterium album]|uniref:Periplasmic heavy metal sensor n=1 Tax=Flavobacterium album TaxID=2175091 RepID=A0A2S1QZV9_9FLAO|nr:periplasmic heavy metal sensor [Flavobacterium album]AWH85967.1 hypothetical protein HYN59_12990 [Flavobacterium album]